MALGGAAGYAGAKVGGKSSGCHSFAAGTLVLMADGTTKAIEDIRIGDEVAAPEPHTGTTTDQPVTAFHLNQDTDLTDVTVAVPANAARRGRGSTGDNKMIAEARPPAIMYEGWCRRGDSTTDS
jgi:hypothetical protein